MFLHKTSIHIASYHHRTFIHIAGRHRAMFRAGMASMVPLILDNFRQELALLTSPTAL